MVHKVVNNLDLKGKGMPFMRRGDYGDSICSG